MKLLKRVRPHDGETDGEESRGAGESAADAQGKDNTIHRRGMCHCIAERAHHAAHGKTGALAGAHHRRTHHHSAKGQLTMKPQKQDLLHFQGVPPPGDGARVATYRRYSSGKQKATTLQKQQDSIEESLDELHPTWRILPDGEYADPKKTARDDTFENRPGLQQLIADAQAGKFDVVIVESVDRWSRSSAVTWNTLAILHACGVYWMTTDGFDSVTIRQEGTSASCAHAAEAAAQVSRTISKKVVRGKRTRTKQG